jgi:ubiquinone/menaquinone biosynthesis C-methylase UbiE
LRRAAELKAAQAAAWGAGAYERIARTLAPMHAALVERLAPHRGESWLDVATGTGEVACRAAEAGAIVTGVDLAAALVEKARDTAAALGLDVRFDVGDAEALPYADAAFDVVSSSVGLIFAPDHARAAAELARVCRLGGRVGLTAWRPDGGVGDFFRLMAPFQSAPPEGVGSFLDWGREKYVTARLGGTFDLEFDELDCPYERESGEAAWDELSSAYGPTKALAESLTDARREQLRRAVVEFYEGLRSEAGVRHSRAYLLVVGKRAPEAMRAAPR